MKIKELKTYQAVRFAGNQESYFHNSIRGMQNIKMETVEWGILVTTEKDQAIISFANAAYAKPEVTLEHKEVEKPKAVKKPA